MSSGPPPNPDGAPTTDQSTAPQQDPDVSWEGDKMFNIYIHDYCTKRGYSETATALKREAGVPDDSHPPINAKQGLLFEWWSVFWVLFSAKSSGTGGEEALLYTQYQNERRQQEGSRNPALNRPPQAQPPTQTRLLNGMRNGQPGQLPNGVPPGPAMHGAQPHLTNGIANAYPGGIGQPNGVATGPTGPALGTPAGQPMIPGQQRSGPPPQRINGVPFRSPTMAPSPQNPGVQQSGQLPNAMGGPPGAQQVPRGPMGPPNGQLGMPGAPPMHPGAFPQHPSTPSQPNSPASHGMPVPSPGMANRTIPTRPAADGQNTEQIRQLQESSINAELFRIESSKLPELKQELGLAHRDLPSLTVEEKTRIVGLAKARNLLPMKPAVASAAGPSNPMQPGQPSNQGRPIGQSPMTAVGQIPRPGKRSSTSPGEDGESSQHSDSTSPANKRIRKSPSGGDQSSGPPPMTPMMPFPQAGVPGPPHGPAGSGMIPRGMPLPFAGPQGGPGMQMGPMGTPHMGNTMIGPHPVTPQMAQPRMQYRQTMQQLHKPPIGGVNAGSPVAGAESPYNGDGQPRPGQFGVPGPAQNRPGMPPRMLPPPSPGMIQGKPGGVTNKNETGVNASPQNAAAVPGQPGGPQQQQQQPPQPGHMGPGANASGPSGLMNQGGGTAPPTPSGPPSNMGTPSLNTNQPMNHGPPSAVQQPPPPPPPTDMFMGDFGTFTELDTSMFGSGDTLGGLGNVDFSADFNEWFNDPTLIGGDMK